MNWSGKNVMHRVTKRNVIAPFGTKSFISDAVFALSDVNSVNEVYGPLELENVSLSLGRQILISAISLRIEVAEIVTLMGASGSGKSTLLAYMCGALPPAFTASGRVKIAGRDITCLSPEQRRLGILFQDDLLFPHMSVGDNLAFALTPAVSGKIARRMRVERALAEAGLEGFAERDPATLSGGQRARVAMMRTLLSEPQALLLDEPFSKLDIATREQFRRFVFEHARSSQLPTLMVTHDPADAQAAGGVVIQIEILRPLQQAKV